MLTAQQILGYKRRARLFSPDADAAKKQYKELAKLWHPDTNKDPIASEVFQHIKELYEGNSEFFEFESNNKKYRFQYLNKFEIDIGTAYNGQNSCCFVIDKSWLNLYNNSIKLIKSIVVNQRDELIKPYLPTIKWAEENIVIIKYPNQSIRLADIPEIPPKHLMWIINRVLGGLVYLHGVQNIVLNDISKETLWIHPVEHSVTFVGGWWYAAFRDKPISQVPARTIGVMPNSIRTAKCAKPETDLECVRLLVREIIGDQFTAENRGFSRNVIDWSNHPSTNSKDDWKEWNKIIDSLGPRKYVKLDITQEKIYG